MIRNTRQLDHEHICVFSFEKIKEMQQNQTVFHTAGGRRELRIAEVDEIKKTVRMQRSTGKLTWPLDYQRLAEVHDLIHQGLIPLDPEAIDKEIIFWGNYITGLLKHLGCR